MRPDVREESIDVGGLRLHVRLCGEGPLLLLLHGWPQTSYAWRHLMPVLGERFTVAAPDLRGYGQSDRPRDGYDKRTMATDMSGLMHALGFDTATVVGHDRGARVARRWALDRPSEVSRLVLVSIVPTREMWGRMDARLATSYFHWFLHRIPDLPELLVEGKAETYIRFMYDRGAANKTCFSAEDMHHYIESYSQPGALHASFDDYRADFGEDLAADDVDADAGRRLAMPTLVLWGGTGLIASLAVLEIWRAYADDLIGFPIRDCGHFPAEEQPQQVIAQLTKFLPQGDSSCAP